MVCSYRGTLRRTYVSRPHVQRLLLHDDNQGVCFILSAMVSAYRPMMADLRRLQVTLQTLGVRIEARRLPFAVSRSPKLSPGPGIQATCMRRASCSSRSRTSAKWTRLCWRIAFLEIMQSHNGNAWKTQTQEDGREGVPVESSLRHAPVSHLQVHSRWSDGRLGGSPLATASQASAISAMWYNYPRPDPS